MKIEENYSLLQHNTFRLAVKTHWFMEYESEEELSRILHDEYFHACPSVHIGCGSNLLFLGDYHGIVLHSAIRGIETLEETGDETLLRIGAGEVWDDVVAYAVAKGWGGIENLSGIPGETGAAAVQNIGAYGAEIKDVITSVEAYDRHSGEKHVYTKDACRFAYRFSRFKDEAEYPQIITHVCLRLNKTPRLQLEYAGLKAALQEETPAEVRKAVLALRSQKLPDPAEWGNAGSFFMNPVIATERYEDLRLQYPDMPSFPAGPGQTKIPAAWLIEQCGFKGKTHGEVGVYEKQPLVLINRGKATGMDIALVAESIRTAVAERFNIELTPEVKYIGS